MEKMKPIIITILMVFILASCKQEEVVYEPIKKTGNENTQQAPEEFVEVTEESNLPQNSNQTQEESSERNFNIRVTATSLNVRSEAAPNAAILQSVQQNQELTVEATVQDADGKDWYRIRIPETNNTGYIIAEFT